MLSHCGCVFWQCRNVRTRRTVASFDCVTYCLFQCSVFSSTHCFCGYAPRTCGLCSQVPTASAGMLLVHMVCVLKYPLRLRVCSSYMWSVFSSTHCVCGYAPRTCGLCSQVPSASAGMLLVHVVCVLKYPLALRVCSSYIDR